MDRRRLSVGPGDRRELQLPGRVVEKLRRDVGERRARVGDQRDGDPDVDRMLGHHGDRAVSDRVLGEAVPITVKARDRDE